MADDVALEHEIDNIEDILVDDNPEALLGKAGYSFLRSIYVFEYARGGCGGVRVARLCVLPILPLF